MFVCGRVHYEGEYRIRKTKHFGEIKFYCQKRYRWLFFSIWIRQTAWINAFTDGPCLTSSYDLQIDLMLDEVLKYKG